MTDPGPDSSEPPPLREPWRGLALVWVSAVVLLYLAVRELGLIFTG